MARNDTYTDLDGSTFTLADLDAAERAVVRRCRRFIDDNRDWFKYTNYWPLEVRKLYSARGLSQRKITDTIVWRIAEDMGSRLMVASGLARHPDYRDEIEELIRGRFRTRREFCKATGLSEDMLSHVLAKRKHLAIDTLADALARIGYSLHIAPLPETK